jgi:molybdate/tungstate transport system permease protein
MNITEKRSLFQWILMLSGGMILLFLVAPVAGILFSQSPAKVWFTSTEPQVAHSIRLTLWTSFSVTLLAAFGAIPLSYLLARKRFFGKKFLQGIINLPVVIPHSAAGIALLGVISRDTPAGRIAEAFGLQLTGNPAAIMLAMAFVSLPFLINAATDAFRGVPEDLEKAAFNLGASEARTFFTISLPLAWRGIVTGLIMMWARGMSEFGAVVIVAYHPMVTPVLIYERFTTFGLHYATPVAVLVILISLLVFIGMRFLSDKPEKTNRHA